MTTFTQLGVPEQLVRSLASRGIVEPFPIQSSTIPDALAGRDVAGKAPTGAGKTLAFGIPLAMGVERAKPQRPTALVLAPTRELAEQIKEELEPLTRVMSRSVLAVYGGVGYGRQTGPLRRGVDVLVATPGRLEDLIQQRHIDLRDVTFVVVDEADRMADMGFLPAVRRILDRTSKQRQTLLFSATLDRDVAILIKDYQRDPARHDVVADPSTAIDVRHHFWSVPHEDKVSVTAQVVESTGSSIVFTRTRHRADRLARQLSKLGIDAAAIHGGRSQRQRTTALRSFASGRSNALVATDVAARGIHVDAVSSVIHFDVAGDTKDYVHRSGRTGRAGAEGIVVTLVANDQRAAARAIMSDVEPGSRLGPPQADSLKDSAGASRPSEDSRERQTPSEEKESVYVANLPWATTAADLERLFQPFGPVRDATIVTDRRTGRSRGFGFVDMSQGGARTAIGALHGTSLEGRDLTVRPARPRS